MTPPCWIQMAREAEEGLPLRSDPEFRVVVTGSRALRGPDAEAALWDALYGLLDAHPDLVVIEGGATGADEMARAWAKRCGVPNRSYPADWSKYGRAGGPIRNGQMLREEEPDLLLVCPGGKGTLDMETRAIAAGVPIQRVAP